MFAVDLTLSGSGIEAADSDVAAEVEVVEDVQQENLH